MRHHILPPHLTSHLAKKNAKFRAQLHQDMGLRHVRAALGGKHVEGEIAAYDNDQSMDLPPKHKASQNLPQAQRIRKWAEVTSEVMGVGDFPDGVVRYGVDYVNAFYDGQYLVFGLGDGEIFGDFTLGLDVFAHEFGHKLIEAGPGLEYFGQPGALNEHLADVMGVSVREKNRSVDAKDYKPDWRIGADLFLDGKSALRDMKEPGTAYDNLVLGKDPQVGHMDDYSDGFVDNGGVHINSGIPNRAFAIFAELTDSPAWEVPLRTWMRAGNKSGPETDFEQFAKHTLDVAGKYETEVVKAWAECGIDLDGHAPSPAPAPAPEPKPEPSIAPEKPKAEQAPASEKPKDGEGGNS